jgi:hypothetical protein
VLRKQRIHDLRHHRRFVAEHALEERAAAGEARQEILANLILYRSRRAVVLAERRALQGTKGRRKLLGHGRIHPGIGECCTGITLEGATKFTAPSRAPQFRRA